MALTVDSEMAANVAFGIAGVSPSPPSTPQTYSFTNAAGTVLYLFVVLSVNSGGTTAFGTVTYGGVAMTKILDQTSVSGASRLGWFRLLSPPTGSNTVSIAHTMVTAGGGFSAIESGCISYVGNDTTTPEVQSAGSNGSSATAAGSLSGVVAGNITICGAGAGSSMTAQTQTLSCAANTASTSQVGNGRMSRSTTSGSVTHSFTISASDSWITGTIEVAAAVSTPDNFVAAAKPLLFRLQPFQRFGFPRLGFPQPGFALAPALNNYELSADPGTYALTGVNASPIADRIVNAVPGAYTLTGTAATPIAGRMVNAATGSYTLTGTAASLVSDRLIGADPGSYAINGVAATLLYTAGAAAFTISADPGSYTLTGIAASPVADRMVNTAPGSYALTGVAASVVAGREVNAAPGAYTLTGVTVTMLLTRVIGADPGTYTLTGVDATLDWSGFTPPATQGNDDIAAVYSTF